MNVEGILACITIVLQLARTIINTKYRSSCTNAKTTLKDPCLTQSLRISYFSGPSILHHYFLHYFPCRTSGIDTVEKVKEYLSYFPPFFPLPPEDELPLPLPAPPMSFGFAAFIFESPHPHGLGSKRMKKPSRSVSPP